MRLNINKKHVLVAAKTASRLAYRSYKNISSVDFDVRPLQRIHYLFIATLVLAPTLSTLYIELRSSKLYALTKEEKSFINKATIDTKLIKETANAFTYARADEKQTNSLLPQIITSAPEDSTGMTDYTAKLSKNPNEGITFGDENGTRNIVFKPLSSLFQGRLDNGSVIYPANSIEKHIYTFKKNGLKEDILLLEPSSKEMQFSWKLDISKDLEAKLLPDGSVGFYSADPVFYNNLTIADDLSKDMIDKARSKNSKNYLAYIMPRPFIVEADGSKSFDDVYFKLEGSALTLRAQNMINKKYPLSIDPTITVTSTTDFRTSYGNDANIDYGTSGQITNASITSGGLPYTLTALGSLSNTTLTAREVAAGVAYNGYVYQIGGFDNSSGNGLNTVQYAYICDGTTTGGCTAGATNIGKLGTWAYTTSFTTGKGYLKAAAYNGYIYITGGQASGLSGPTADVQYALICTGSNSGVLGCSASAGTVGIWLTTTSFQNVRTEHGAVAYNGYLYVVGGSNGANPCSIEYAPILAGGGIGAWVTNSTSLPDSCSQFGLSVYNGYMYVAGGFNDTDILVDGYSNTYYASINTSDGSIGTWTGTYSFKTGRDSLGMVASNGYLYISGGSSYTLTLMSDVQYAAIKSDGSLGPWVTSNDTIGTARMNHISVAYNGYVYFIGGADTNGNVVTTNYAGKIGDGAVGNVLSGTTYPTSRYGHSSVAYNGYIYVIGGCDTGTAPSQCTTFLNNISYSPILTADTTYGQNSTWAATTTTFTTPRYGHSSVVSGGRLYVLGGCSANAASVCTGYLSDVQYANIAANGNITGTWSTTTSYTTARWGHTSEVINGYLYVIGGQSGTVQSNIQYSLICTGSNTGVQGCSSSPGSIGTWSAATSLSTARYIHASANFNGYLYVLGGWNGSSYFNTVEYFLVCTGSNSGVDGCSSTSGALGNQHTSANSFTTGRYGVGATISSGRLFVTGGIDSASAITNTVQSTPINTSTGDVGIWSVATSWSTTTRFFGTFVNYNGFGYSIGGCTVAACSTQTAVVSYAFLGAPNYLTMQKSVYERYIDSGANNYAKEIVINGSAACNNFTITYKGSGTSSVALGSPVTATVTAGASHILQVYGARYLFLSVTMNDNNCLTTSYITDIVVTSINKPNAPTLFSPSNNAVGTVTNPKFTLGSTSSNSYGDYLQYKIEVCLSSDCTNIVRTIDQNSSLTGWSGMSQGSGVGYLGSLTLSELGNHQYQSPALSNSTQYWWRAYAIDPKGSNTWSSPSNISSFTTMAAGTLNITGGTIITSGSTISP